ncbi:MAG TPA: NAD(P)/FAD-dependent oxidoreductase [Candidatus Methylacidiphilales bacterium]|nr:NAD(P)/FAD-dependent oxidoreductase [Candidatus Methylacidiphilales bacterium]
MAKPIVIMGAGPAGLTAAWELTRAGKEVVVWESDPVYVGGLSRTVRAEGFRFDIGGHRFFSKSQEVNEIWRQIMPDNFIDCPRMSRIYYRKKYFNYPLEAMNAFRNLGPVETFRILLSYIEARVKPIKPETTFAQWVTNRFGERLFLMFFKAYTEKVWGISCDEISADWAAQRIKGLSLREAVLSAFQGKKTAPTAKTLIRHFFYPRLGPGQMWETAAEKIMAAGNKVVLDRKVQTIHWDETGVTHITGISQTGEFFQQEGDHFISSIPLQELMLSLDPPPPKEVVAAAKRLRYRDFITVCVVVNRANVFPDTWIYIHDPSVRVGRIQNYKNWSMEMVPDPGVTSLGMEYFCFENDGLWLSSDYDLAQLAIREAEQIGLIRAEEVQDAFVVRMPKAYPIYNQNYQENVKAIRDWVSLFANLQPVGRNGMHHYNNQDHSMMTAMLAARNTMGDRHYDCWKVNTEAEYHEQDAPQAK